MATPPFSPSVLSEATYWARFLSEEWTQDFKDVPTQLHSRTELSDNGTPQWQRAFGDWLDGNSESRQRTTKVMRKLRRAAPREYEVLYRAMVSGESFEDITIWLNERALRNGIVNPGGRPDGYRIKDSVALFLAGIDYARAYF